jgi:hypothetical protein
MQIERDLRAVIDEFVERFLEVNIAAIAEDDDNVVFAVRVPRESLGPDPYPAGLADDTVGADIAASIAARIRQI